MGKLQVLVIEDDRDTANYYVELLSLLGYETEIVLSAKAALARLASQAPHLIFLDLNLGSEIDGEDILYQVRSNPRLDQTRVIVITAYPIMTRMIAGLADLVLIKPVDIDQLKSLVSRITSPDYDTKQLGFRDPVTNLFNREFLLTRLEHAFQRAHRRADFLFAVLAFSLSGEGRSELETQRAAWNLLLREISNRLLQHLRPTDTLTRLSGWKYALLLEELKEPDDIHLVIHRLQAVLMAPFDVNGEHYLFDVHFGGAVYPRDLKRSRDLLEMAERALEAAQASGKLGVQIAPPGLVFPK
jgi:diguanylate cyclase (GGDEF)-like protein